MDAFMADDGRVCALCVCVEDVQSRRASSSVDVDRGSNVKSAFLVGRTDTFSTFLLNQVL